MTQQNGGNMTAAIKFINIENEEIFTENFKPLTKNNEISFQTSEKIAIIYGPNGAGKTSLIKVLSDEKGTTVEFEYYGKCHTSGKSIFHIINDQNNRNIIKGETKDFFLGDNIKREFELQEYVASARTSLIDKMIITLKSYGVSAASSLLIDLITPSDIKGLIKDIANKQSRGDKYTTEDFVALLATISPVTRSESDDAKLQFLENDFADKNSIIRKIEQLDTQILTSNPHVHEIEENDTAIEILNRFQKDQCIVCDHEGINREALLIAKTDNRSSVFQSLNEELQEIFKRIVDLVPNTDPFHIKELLIESISKGDTRKLRSLLIAINEYKQLYCSLLLNDLSLLVSESGLSAKMTEYQTLLAEKPEITEEDVLYIEEIISNSMGKSLTLQRDKNKNLRIFLSDREFLGKSRDELPLSTGEQNFLSLTFEFLKAKNSACPVVVVDDPISSFDSIYKNKVVYAIVKILHKKERVVLTHNTDLLRLLECQYKNCYKLYLLNNADREENGFIPVNYNEQGMLISLEKLLGAFRYNIHPHIQDVGLFLISMIPFMRGYSIIINNTGISEELTQLMHGYKTEKVDVAKVYNTLFECKDNKLQEPYVISVPDILRKTVEGVHLLDVSCYPLLDKTLRHTFTYLFLRLMVEKALVQKFCIDTNKYKQLGQIISAAFPNENDFAQIRNRIRLTSKKTLINEFNHFEGNLSIFQPAIDITDQVLDKERADLEAFVRNL